MFAFRFCFAPLSRPRYQQGTSSTPSKPQYTDCGEVSYDSLLFSLSISHAFQSLCGQTEEVNQRRRRRFPGPLKEEARRTRGEDNPKSWRAILTQHECQQSAPGQELMVLPPRTQKHAACLLAPSIIGLPSPYVSFSQRWPISSPKTHTLDPSYDLMTNSGSHISTPSSSSCPNHTHHRACFPEGGPAAWRNLRA